MPGQRFQLDKDASAPCELAEAKTDAIVDNRARRVVDFLRREIASDSDMSIVSAYFTIYAYEALRKELEGTSRVRFLYGEPHGTGTVGPDGDEARSFRLNEDGGIEPRHTLAQKPLARACAAWIREQVDIRTITRSNFLHGKLYHVMREGRSGALIGSSNFTRRGLGLGAVSNIELNIDVRCAGDRNALLSWFNDLWANELLTRNAKADVLAALERLGQRYDPEFVYYKTLFHIFDEWLGEHGEREGLFGDLHLFDTAIWKALYPFQRDGARSAINRLLRYNGCIVADSVGLGKTWTALAVIKFFEKRNERVLVLCPKRLEGNWTRYTAWANSCSNPFADDRFEYNVRAHTDLSRYKGYSGAVNLAEFNWGAFGLVVIDESHNFRNEGRDQRDDDGNVVRRSRYNRVLHDLLKSGIQTRVLMLSATPVNNNLRDLRNQIYLMTEGRRNAFHETLGIGDIQLTFAKAQQEFLRWEKERGAGEKLDKASLLERLGADFLSLLDATTFARSRVHIQRYYPQVIEDIGGFPKRTKPETLTPKSDSQGTLAYDDLHQQIGNLRLAVYKPSQYLIDPLSLDREKGLFNQVDREHSLIGMIRVNMLKRLESSVHAFVLTMSRILDKIQELDGEIDKWRMDKRSGGMQIPDDTQEDEEDDEFVIGEGRRYRLDELDVDRWQKDLLDDRKVLEELYLLAKQVTVERDAKLAELKRVLQRKVENPTNDKDGRSNRKVLVFTTFSDTAQYLYDNLKCWVRNDLGVHIALVTGVAGNRSTTSHTRSDEILGRFAPRAQLAGDRECDIDILIATDCLSEGQNLQDCDLVVNYDIHWNPVRLMQRFGRIDRLGSRNQQVQMINFWPTEDLDRYLDLKCRVEARMALVDATATGFDDPLDSKNRTQKEQAIQAELAFRDEQLKRMRNEVLDVEEVDDGVGLNDLTLDDFVADLLQYIEKNRRALEDAPFGINAIVADESLAADSNLSDLVRPGVIFCFKRIGDASAPTPNRLWPYFLVYVYNDGSIRYTFRQARQCLWLFRMLAKGQPKVAEALERAFDDETKQGRGMEKYDTLLESALRDINGTFQDAELDSLARNRGAILTEKAPYPNPVEEFTLVTWLVVATRDGE